MFVHMSIHYPKPGKEELILESMGRFSAAMKKQPGHISGHALKDEATGRLIGLALWESREAWEKGIPAVRDVVKDDPFNEWEERDPEVFTLNEMPKL